MPKKNREKNSKFNIKRPYTQRNNKKKNKDTRRDTTSRDNKMEVGRTRCKTKRRTMGTYNDLMVPKIRLETSRKAIQEMAGQLHGYSRTQMDTTSPGQDGVESTHQVMQLCK